MFPLFDDLDPFFGERAGTRPDLVSQTGGSAASAANMSTLLLRDSAKVVTAPEPPTASNAVIPQLPSSGNVDHDWSADEEEAGLLDAPPSPFGLEDGPEAPPAKTPGKKRRLDEEELTLGLGGPSGDEKKHVGSRVTPSAKHSGFGAVVQEVMAARMAFDATVLKEERALEDERRATELEIARERLAMEREEARLQREYQLELAKQSADARREEMEILRLQIQLAAAKNS
ncbi:hypothetical protein HKX48_001729 [Thoreauomyces humboldtii]|nr:hypothetical protein HKX48_001729 [Thoreauomyces humboldtii]